MALWGVMTVIMIAGEKRSGKEALANLLLASAESGVPRMYECSTRSRCEEARAAAPDHGPVVFGNVMPGWIDAFLALGRERSGLTIVTAVTDRKFPMVDAFFHMNGASGALWMSPTFRLAAR